MNRQSPHLVYLDNINIPNIKNGIIQIYQKPHLGGKMLFTRLGLKVLNRSTINTILRTYAKQVKNELNRVSSRKELYNFIKTRNLSHMRTINTIKSLSSTIHRKIAAANAISKMGLNEPLRKKVLSTAYPSNKLNVDTFS